MNFIKRIFAATLEAEIFSEGTWNGTTYTREDLHEMVRNFTVLKNLLKPMLKLGHDDAQKWFGQEDGAPSLGWVSALRVQDGKLLATFSDVFPPVATLIAKGAYRRVSAEIYHDISFEENGQEVVLGKALGAVALLGADQPAVTNLADLAAQYIQKHPGEARKFTGGTLQAVEMETQHEEEPVKRLLFTPQPPSDEALRVALENATKALNTANEQITELKKKDEDREKLAQEEKIKLGVKEFLTHREAVIGKVEKLVQAGLVPPYLAKSVHEEVLLQERGYAGGELRFTQKTLITLLDAVEKGEIGKGVAKFKATAKGKVSDGAQTVNASATLAEKVQEVMKANPKMSFAQATIKAAQENPDLKDAAYDQALEAAPTHGKDGQPLSN